MVLGEFKPWKGNLMNKHIVMMTLIAVTLTGCAAHHMGVQSRCRQTSWNPEVHRYSGSKAKIIQELRSNTEQLSDRRVFTEVTKGKSSTDVRYFEQVQGDVFTLTEWKTPEGYDVVSKINKTIDEFKGKECVGEKVKELLQGDLKGGKVSKVTLHSWEQAFAPAVIAAIGEPVKVIISLLC
jgi:hypothetical protein